MYYLLIFWSFYTSTGVTSRIEQVQFSNQATCLTAATAINEARNANSNGVDKMKLFCVQK